MHRWYGLAVAARSRWRPCLLRILTCCSPPHSSSSSPSSSLPLSSYTPRLCFATGGGGYRRGSDDEDDESDDDESDEDDEFEEDEDPSDYEWDHETWNLLHQGKEPGETSRKWPLPMYKAREMVDFHMQKNRLDGLKVIQDPEFEYEVRRDLHEGLVDFYKRTQAAFDEIDAAYEKKRAAIEAGETVKIGEGKTESQDQERKAEDESPKEESSTAEAKEASLQGGEAEGKQRMEGEFLETEFKKEEAQLRDVDAPPAMDASAHSADASTLAMEASANAESAEASPMTTAVDDILKDVLSLPEITTIEVGNNAVETIDENEVNAFDYDKWVAYQEQEVAKRYAEQEKRKIATLRWKIQLVLGPGDAWHPANRKVSVSVYVRELGLSKYAKQRLLALVGKRYKSPQDELTITSERYQHRYENQKDVLRTLLALIEEAQKADQLVNDARIAYTKAQNAEMKALRTTAVASLSAA